MTEYSYIDNLEAEAYVINQLSSNRHLNDWEKGFIKSIKEYTESGGFLSANQKQKLSDLWEKY